MAKRFSRKIDLAASIYRAHGLRGLLIGMVNFCSGYDSFRGLPEPGSGEVIRKKADPPAILPPRCILPAEQSEGQWLASKADAETEGMITELRLCGKRINPARESCKGRLLLLSHELSRTGAPGVLLEAAKLLCEAGYYVAVAAPDAEGPQPTALAEDFVQLGIPIYLDRSLLFGRLGNPMPAGPCASPFFHRLCEAFDAVLCNSFATHNIVKELNGGEKPVIWWIHEGKRFYEDVRPEYYPLPLRENVQVYCVGKYAQAMLQELSVPIGTRSLLYGIEDRAELYPIRAHEKVRFVICGSIDRQKNQLTMVRAIARLTPQERENAEFLFVGGYADEGYYQKVVRAAKGLDCIRFLGILPNREVLALYAASDCVALPSIDDTMPVVLTEGMMLRRIILCSRRTGTAYYLEEGKSGFLFDPNDVKELSEKLRYILAHIHDPALRSMGEAARRIYEQEFTTEVFRRDLLAAVEEARSGRQKSEEV